MQTNVTLEEMKEIFKKMEEQGLNPQWCNTPVPCFESPEQAQKFMNSKGITPDGYMWMPEQMVKDSAASAPAGEESTDKA
jgi:hypothetical protein